MNLLRDKGGLKNMQDLTSISFIAKEKQKNLNSGSVGGLTFWMCNIFKKMFFNQPTLLGLYDSLLWK